MQTFMKQVQRYKKVVGDGDSTILESERQGQMWKAHLTKKIMSTFIHIHKGISSTLIQPESQRGGNKEYNKWILCFRSHGNHSIMAELFQNYLLHRIFSEIYIYLYIFGCEGNKIHIKLPWSLFSENT